MRKILFVLALLLPAPAFADTAILNWVDNSNNETGFKIQRQLNGGAFADITTTAVNVVSATDTTLVASTTVDNVYCYRVYAFNSAGNSAYTNTVCKTIVKVPPPVTLPAAASNLTIQ